MTNVKAIDIIVKSGNNIIIINDKNYNIINRTVWIKNIKIAMICNMLIGIPQLQIINEPMAG